MEKPISPDTTLFISGASGVGKTEVSRLLLKTFPQFLILQEVDIVREAVRGYRESVVNSTNLEYDSFYDNILFKSTSELSISDFISQSIQLEKPIRNVCNRLKSKKIPTIIEGTNLLFNRLLTQECENGYFINSPNMFFVNLFVSDGSIHQKRWIQKGKKNIYKDTNVDFSNLIKINDYLKTETECAINRFNSTVKIINIDTTYISKNQIVDIIISFLNL